MKELWKTIKGYPNYKISNLGRIKRVPHKYRKTELILKYDISKGGYYRVPLSKEGKYKKYLVSRLVAMHFISNPKNLPEVNHKDGDKANNKKSNLEWSTQSYNMQHAFKTGLKTMTKGEDCSWSKLKEKDVHKIRTSFYLGWANMRELAEQFKLNKTTVWEIIHRKIWRHI